eukprot:6187268-Pleurochrysis_carterae.AAC.4
MLQRKKVKFKDRGCSPSDLLATALVGQVGKLPVATGCLPSGHPAQLGSQKPKLDLICSILLAIVLHVAAATDNKVTSYLCLLLLPRVWPVGKFLQASILMNTNPYPLKKGAQADIKYVGSSMEQQNSVQHIM